jgi:hypothetical protein
MKTGKKIRSVSSKTKKFFSDAAKESAKEAAKRKQLYRDLGPTWKEKYIQYVKSRTN